MVKKAAKDTELADLLNEVVVEEDDNVVESPEQQSKVVSYLDPEWSDFVLSQLDETEFRDAYPSVVGLRRVTEKLLGPIIRSYAREVKSVGEEIVCIYEIDIQWMNYNGAYPDIRTFSGVAGTSEVNNQDQLFRKFPSAVAETRAEARALRKALRLNTVVAEEVDSKDIVDSDPITYIQKAGIKNRCDVLKLNLDEFLKSNGFENLDKLTKVEATSLMTKLNKIQTNRE